MFLTYRIALFKEYINVLIERKYFYLDDEEIKVTREFSLTVEMLTVIFVDNKTSKNTGDENIFVWNSCTNKNLQHKLL